MSGSTNINKLKIFTSARLFCFIDIFTRKIWRFDLDRKSTNLMQNWLYLEDHYQQFISKWINTKFPSNKILCTPLHCNLFAKGLETTLLNLELSPGWECCKEEKQEWSLTSLQQGEDDSTNTQQETNCTEKRNCCHEPAEEKPVGRVDHKQNTASS